EAQVVNRVVTKRAFLEPRLRQDRQGPGVVGVDLKLDCGRELVQLRAPGASSVSFVWREPETRDFRWQAWVIGWQQRHAASREGGGLLSARRTHGARCRQRERQCYGGKSLHPRLLLVSASKLLFASDFQLFTFQSTSKLQFTLSPYPLSTVIGLMG